jgi:hypothetical protein
MNKRSPNRLVDMSNFNITWRNLKYLLPILALIIIPVLFRINFGLTRIGDIVVSVLIAIILYNIPWFKVSEADYQKINEGKQKTFLLIFLPIIGLLIALPVFYGPFVESFIINTLKINPDTALDSIRAFLHIR